jgi:hypothetical protein
MQNPWVAFISTEAIVLMKFEVARVRGNRIPSPPERNPMWLIRVVYSGNSCASRSDAKEVLMIESMFDVSGPFQSSQGGSGCLVG